MAAKPNNSITPQTDAGASKTASASVVSTRESVQISISGPLPAPRLLAEYDTVLPGLAERIVNRWEMQSDHRMALEKTVIDGDNVRANWGLVSATLISLSVLGVSAVLAMHDHETVAAVLAGIDVAALAGVFVYGTSSRKRERTEKIKTLAGRDAE